MKTPYDAALRLRQREIDEVRVAINVEVNQITMLDDHRDAIDASVRAERDIASRHVGFSADAFAARMRTRRAEVCRDRDASDERLVALRTRAIEAYGSLSAIGAAADRHRDDATRAADLAEQSQVDDFAAARFSRVLRAARRLRAEPVDGA